MHLSPSQPVRSSFDQIRELKMIEMETMKEAVNTSSSALLISAMLSGFKLDSNINSIADCKG